MRIASVGQVFFAATMIVLGILGWLQGDFTVIWQPVPTGLPGRVALIYLCASVCLATGIGLLFRRTAAVAARVLLGYFLLWLLLMRVPGMLISFTVNFWWAAAQVAVLTAAAWVLYRFANDWDTLRFGFGTGDKGLRIARVLYGLGMIPFGIAHFVYLQHTAEMVPAWLPWHIFWAKFFGWTFIAAVVGDYIIGVYARLAATLSAVEMGLFLVLVWVPVVAAGSKEASDWSETLASVALAAAAWVGRNRIAETLAGGESSASR